MSNIKKFNFLVEHRDGEESHLILERNFGMLFSYKSQLEILDGTGYPNILEDGIFENSYHAVILAQDLFELLRLVLKDASMDYIEKYSHSDEIPKPNENAEYVLRIIDMQYPKRDSFGRIYQEYIVTYKDGTIKSLTSENVSYMDLKKDKTVKSIEIKEFSSEREIFNFSFSAKDFIPFNPNFIPHFWKIWKDFSDYRSDNPNAKVADDGVTKLSMYNGIRSLIKNSLSANYNDYINRFKNVEITDNKYFMA